MGSCISRRRLRPVPPAPHPPTEQRLRISAQLHAQPGLEAVLELVQVGGVTHAVPSVVGHGITAADESPPGATLDA